MADDGVSFVSAAQAKEIDEKLMGPEFGFSIDQLMELAGLSVASATCEVYPPRSHRRVLVLAGPGNNGGDGLVAARHLLQFGYSPTVVYPKRPSKPLFVNLATQMEMNGIPLLDALPSPLNADVVLDAIFGFSFKGAVRAPFDAILPALRDSGVPLVSVDVPSGWDVEAGPGDDEGALQPDVLVSLTMPKKCAAHFRGAGGHYLGGRFVPPALAKKYGFVQPPFLGTDQVVKL